MNLVIDFSDSWYNEIIYKAVFATLEFENFQIDTSLEVIIASKEEIKEINASARNIDKVTDVLSFPMFDSAAEAIEDETGTAFIGSMIICKERAIEQAQEYGHSIEREVAFLAVHSTLHLLGYDHELGEKEEKEMFSKQETILQGIGLTR